MYRRTAAALATAATAGALALGAAGAAQANPGPGYYANSSYSSYADCQAAGRPATRSGARSSPASPSAPTARTSSSSGSAPDENGRPRELPGAGRPRERFSTR
ncbi:hypothetical protein O1L60_26990 [Streptomyces diastatochromogenes]|nr:hypothetical protein [Streptomyces diastatochromogenes]